MTLPCKAQPTIWLRCASVLLLAMLSGCAQQNIIPTPADFAPATQDQNDQIPVASDQTAVRPASQPTSDALAVSPVEPTTQHAGLKQLSPEEQATRLELAKEVANPISNLARLPLRFTYQSGIGPKHAYTWGLLASPLIPFNLSENWDLVVQTNVPLDYVAPVADGVDSKFGLGDTLQGFYIVPTAPGRRGWIYGVGPEFLWPTATNDSLGAGKFGAGPTAAIIRQVGGFTYGAVAYQVWSYAGDEDRRSVDSTVLHPLFTYTFPTATSVTFDSASEYDWLAHQWTVPVQFTLAQVVLRNPHPVQLSITYRYFADKPAGGPDWGIGFNVIVLFPNN